MPTSPMARPRSLLEGTEVDQSQAGDAETDDLSSPTDAIPPDTAAAVALIEHRSPIPLRQAIPGACGTALADAWLRDEDLARIRLQAG
jgi:hypothetical protein